ncbi:hypothetical protein OpiT1DRAFT_01927 [Opitutaceae bacterium TAV1]|nr:hypothetical protein OpiT1DRAFT_01927 [Opitutaceae bacterium TAV1]
MPATQAPPLTRHDYALIPVGSPNYQLIEGDFVMAPSPSSFHQSIAGLLYRLIGNYLDTRPIGTVFIAPIDVYLSDLNVYQPDVLFIRKENRSIIKKHGIEGAPDLVIEVLSKTSARYDLGPKRAIYARTGVEELWIVDPDRRTLALYRLATDSETPAATYKAADTFSSTLLPGLTISLKAVFAS